MTVNRVKLLYYVQNCALKPPKEDAWHVSMSLERECG